MQEFPISVSMNLSVKSVWIIHQLICEYADDSWRANKRCLEIGISCWKYKQSYVLCHRPSILGCPCPGVISRVLHSLCFVVLGGLGSKCVRGLIFKKKSLIMVQNFQIEITIFSKVFKRPSLLRVKLIIFS